MKIASIASSLFPLNFLPFFPCVSVEFARSSMLLKIPSSSWAYNALKRANVLLPCGFNYILHDERSHSTTQQPLWSAMFDSKILIVGFDIVVYCELVVRFTHTQLMHRCILSREMECAVSCFYASTQTTFRYITITITWLMLPTTTTYIIENLRTL